MHDFYYKTNPKYAERKSALPYVWIGRHFTFLWNSEFFYRCLRDASHTKSCLYTYGIHEYIDPLKYETPAFYTLYKKEDDQVTLV